jgi:acetyl esterase/lipase
MRTRSPQATSEFPHPTPAGVRPSDPLKTPPWPALLTRNTPGHAATPAPVLIAQGTADELVAPAATRALAERLCRLGDTVELRTWWDVGHFDIPKVAADDVAAWIGDRLAGRPARSTCQR